MADPEPFQLPAQTIYVPPPTPVSVVSPQFIAPYPVDLRITKNSMTIGTYVVTDVNGAIMLKIKGSFFSLRDRRVLTDSAGHPVITFQHKLFTLHKKWLAYRGKSTDSKDLLFTIRAPSVFQWSIKLDVILGSNTFEGTCDFKIKKSSTEKFNYTIFLGDGTTIVAHLTQMNPHKLSKILKKDTFRVTVYPNVDYAFIVSLGVILFELLRVHRRTVVGQALEPLSNLLLN